MVKYTNLSEIWKSVPLSVQQPDLGHSQTVGKRGKVRTGCIWHRTETGGGLLWTWWWIFGFHKRRGNSWRD